jgi:hypothetical protein
MLAYNGLNQPGRVLSFAEPLFSHEVRGDFDEPMQALSASYLAVTSLGQLAHPTRDQLATARSAAHQMLSLAPECLKAADWAKARPELEAQARQVLDRH